MIKIICVPPFYLATHRMTETTYWLTFFAAALVINVTPGPDIAYILSRTLAQGRAAGVASSLGVCTGAMVHVVLATIGVSAALAAMPGAIQAVQVAGAIYLIWMAIPALRSKGALSTAHAAEAPASGNSSPLAIFVQGVVVDVLNPKVALFFMAFLPQFIRADGGSSATQMLVLGALVIVVALIVELPLVFVAAKSSESLRRSPKIVRWLDRIFGVVLLMLAARIFWSLLYPNSDDGGSGGSLLRRPTS